MATLPTPEEVTVSVNRNFDKIDYDRLSKVMGPDLERLIKSNDHPKAKNKRLELLVKEAASLVSPVAACRKGCSMCCTMAVTITSVEASEISRAYDIPAEEVTVLKSQEDMVAEYVNVPCVFLKNKECQIYDHRPLACRTHFNLSDYPVQCDTLNHNGLEVPNLDFRDVWGFSSLLAFQMNATFGDIREFFPAGIERAQSL